MSWLITPTPRPEATCQVVCLPSAGSGAVLFRPLSRMLPPDVELIAAALPGREARAAEPPATDLLSTAAKLAMELSRVIRGPYLVFGHSMGGMLAYELCRWLERGSFAPLPSVLTISACVAPDQDTETNVIGQSDAVLTERLASLGGIEPAAAADPELMRTVLPVIRADLEMVERWQPRLGGPLDLDLVVVRGADDHVGRAEQLATWPRFGRTHVEHVRPGKHFWLQEPVNRPWLIEELTRQARLVSAPSRAAA